MMHAPPKLAEWLLERSLVHADRHAAVGDLHEEFRARASIDGEASARRWYWRQVRRSLGPNLRRRLQMASSGHRTASAATPQPGQRVLFRGTWQDVRFAARALRATPTFTAVTLTVLALGIGATTAIFSVVDGVALRGLPFWRSDRLVALTEPRISSTGGGSSVPAADFNDWRAMQTSFEDVAVVQGGGGFITRDAAAPESLRVSMVSPGLFPLLRASPALGRGFVADDAVAGRDHIAILGDAFWSRRFARDPLVVGKTMAFDAGVWTIVGVMPASFTYPVALARPMDMWVPYVLNPAELVRGERRSASASVVGRLKDGVSLAAARADMEGMTARLEQQYPNWFRDRRVGVMSLQDSIVGPVKSWMLMLLGAVAFVLLIACVNVANLMLARATARSRDSAVRAALGASRWRILRSLLIESLVLSVTGTILGVGFAVWAVNILRASLPSSLPRLDEVAVNYRVLVAAALTAIGVALAVTPVWQSSAPALSASLRDASRSGSAGQARQRVRAGLLVAEVALAVVLLVGSGLFISSFVRLIRVDLGFGLPNVLSVDLSPRNRLTQAEIARTGVTLSAVFEEVRRLPGVQSAALVSGTPPLILGSDRTGITVPGRPPVDDQSGADDKSVTSNYFAVLQVPLAAGRYLTDADCVPGAPAVVLLNDIAARRYFGSDDPIGTRIDIGSRTHATVVGVVRSVRLQGPESEPRPEFYTPLNWQQPLGSPLVTLVMRTAADPRALAPSVRAAIHSAAPSLVVPEPRSYEELFGSVVAQRKFNMIVLGLFGLLAITIAAAGIYGVMAYLVEQRTQEIGVRMALGAEPSRVLRMVLGRAAVYMAIGLGIGLAGGWMLSKFVQAFLFKSDAHDPIVYAAAAAVLVTAGLVAAFLPARRAAHVDPVIALRVQ